VLIQDSGLNFRFACPVPERSEWYGESAPRNHGSFNASGSVSANFCIHFTLRIMPLSPFRLWADRGPQLYSKPTECCRSAQGVKYKE